MTESRTPLKLSDKPSDYRTRLYERYVTLQVQADLASLRRLMQAPQPAMERLIRRFFPTDRNSAILDIGCGCGLMLGVLKREGFRNLLGVETSTEQVRMASALGMDCVQEGDLMELLQASTPESWDVIMAMDVLEHFTKDEILHVLESVYRALRPGGMLLLHVPNGEAIFSGKIFFGDFTHQTAFTSKSVHQIAAYSGFSKIECYEMTPVIHGLPSLIRAGVWAAIRNWYRFMNMAETGDLGTTLILSQNLLAVCRKPT